MLRVDGVHKVDWVVLALFLLELFVNFKMRFLLCTVSVAGNALEFL